MKSNKEQNKKIELEKNNIEDNLKEIPVDLNKFKKDAFLKLKEKTSHAINDSVVFAEDASQKIERNIKEGIKKTKESYIVKEFQDKANQLRTLDQKDKTKYKRKIVRGLVKLKDIIFKLVEEFVGKIKIGTQYGKSNIDVLADLAKLKELGIITEKEFDSKKREILDRI